jgi:hypothetical protein
MSFVLKEFCLGRCNNRTVNSGAGSRADFLDKVGDEGSQPLLGGTLGGRGTGIETGTRLEGFGDFNQQLLRGSTKKVAKVLGHGGKAFSAVDEP